jgi:hypothetical protein
VLGEDVARSLRLTPRDRPQEIVVLVHSGEQVWEAVDHEMPDAQRQVVVAVERLFQVGVGRAAIDEAVYARVERHQRVVVIAAFASAELLEQRVELDPLRLRQTLRRAKGGVSLELRAHVRDVR